MIVELCNFTTVFLLFFFFLLAILITWDLRHLTRIRQRSVRYILTILQGRDDLKIQASLLYLLHTNGASSLTYMSSWVCEWFCPIFLPVCSVNSHPPANSSPSYSYHQLGRVRANTCFLQDTWSQPNSSFCAFWILFECAIYPAPYTRAHRCPRVIVSLWLTVETEYIIRPTQRARPILPSRLLATHSCGIQACNLPTTDRTVFCCTTQEPLLHCLTFR